MAANELPTAIQEFIEATNAGDTERFVAAFTDDAYLYDWGREFHGIDGVRAWNRTDNIGKQSRFELISAQVGAEEGEYAITVKVTGNGFNGTGPLKIRLRSDKIASVVIS